MKKPLRVVDSDAASSGPGPCSELDELGRAMADVRRLPPDRRGDRASARPFADGAPAPARPSTTRSSSREPVAPDGEDEGSFAANGVDRRVLRKLKRGEYQPGDSLDVHGMTALLADAGVRRFIERCRSRHRCVCIVHGRGLRSPGNVPVLKGRVRDILRRHGAVLAFADAPRDAGGAGAVYVLLRR